MKFTKKMTLPVTILMAAAIMAGCDDNQELDVKLHNEDKKMKTYDLAGTSWQRQIPAEDCAEPRMIPESSFGNEPANPSYNNSLYKGIESFYGLGYFPKRIKKSDYSKTSYTVSYIDLVTGTDKITFNQDGTYEWVKTYSFTQHFGGSPLLNSTDGTVQYDSEFYLARNTDTGEELQIAGYENRIYKEIKYTGTWKYDQEQDYSEDVWRPVIIETTGMEIINHLAPVGESTQNLDNRFEFYNVREVPGDSTSTMHYYYLDPSLGTKSLITETESEEIESVDYLHINDAPKTRDGKKQLQFDPDGSSAETYTIQ